MDVKYTKHVMMLTSREKRKRTEQGIEGIKLYMHI